MDFLVLPSWSQKLCNYYVIIRVDGRNKTLRRRYYRAVQREKYRLACLGINQRQIMAICRYLSKIDYRGCKRLHSILNEPQPQLIIDFT